MDLAQPSTEVPASHLPESVRVVRSRLQGLEHPEQAAVGVAFPGQGYSLVERQVCRLPPRMVALFDGLFPIALRLLIRELLALGQVRLAPGRFLEVGGRKNRAERYRDQESCHHSAQDGDHGIAPGPSPVTLRGADLPGTDRLLNQEPPPRFAHSPPRGATPLP